MAVVVILAVASCATFAGLPMFLHLHTRRQAARRDAGPGPGRRRRHHAGVLAEHFSAGQLRRLSKALRKAERQALEDLMGEVRSKLPGLVASRSVLVEVAAPDPGLTTPLRLTFSDGVILCGRALSVRAAALAAAVSDGGVRLVTACRHNDGYLLYFEAPKGSLTLPLSLQPRY